MPSWPTAYLQKNGETITVGMPFEQIKREIESRKPDIVGVAGPFTCQIDNTVKVTDLAKQVNPDILTVVGGPHVTMVPKSFLKKQKALTSLWQAKANTSCLR